MKFKWHLIILMVLVSGIYILTGVIWLGVILIMMTAIYLMFSTKKVRNAKGIWYVLKMVGLTIMLFLAGILIRVLFFEIYAINSSSMEAAIIPGDKIIVNKAVLGPNLPRSPFEIPWLNILFYFNDRARSKMDNPWWKPFRLKGISEIAQGDIIVFNRLASSKVPLVKRCIGLPGTSLSVKQGIIVGQENVKWMQQTLIPYELFASNKKEIRHKFDSMGIAIWSLNPEFKKNDTSSFQTLIPVKSLGHINSLHCIDSIFIKEPQNEIISGYLKAVDSVWTIYDFGPIEIPQEGFQITLTPESYILYNSTIKKYENTKIIKSGDEYFLDGKKIYSYTFKKDYYFMMGDNRGDSQDSRYFGFIPKHNIIGRVDMILYSSDNEFNWKRLFKFL